mgnify:CR=1 FL=1
MEPTKFKELCMAYAKAQGDFTNFKKKNYEFSKEMVTKLKQYFKIPDSQFSLFRIDEKNDFKLVHPAVSNAITLRPDSMWQLGIGLTVCTSPENYPQELIMIHILIRNDVEGHFYLKYGSNEEEHKVENSEKLIFTCPVRNTNF